MDPSEWRCACVDDMEGYNGMICRDLSNVMHQDRAGTRPSSACVEPLRRPLAVTAGCWADTSASESACLLRGGHPTERAGSVVWACTPDPVDLFSPRWSPPLQRSAASALPEGSHMPRAEEKSHWNLPSSNIMTIYDHIKCVTPLHVPAILQMKELGVTRHPVRKKNYGARGVA